MPEAAIKTVQLTKKYGDFYGIRDLNLEVHRGEVFGFLGPNGAGKTTSIRMMVDLLKPTEGEVYLLGKKIGEHVYEVLRRTSYLPGEFYPFPELTGVKYLQLVTRNKLGKLDNMDALLQKMQLTGEELHKKIKYYSRGMKQKLGLIQAFAHYPELIIMDEPTSGLDPLMQSAFYEMVHDAILNGSTVFLSSHQLPEVEKICERVAIVKDGRLLHLESLESLRRNRYRKLHIVLKSPSQRIRIPDSIIQRTEGKSVWVLTRAPAEQIIKALSELPLEDFFLFEPDLEEVFMSYYQNKDTDE